MMRGLASGSAWSATRLRRSLRLAGLAQRGFSGSTEGGDRWLKVGFVTDIEGNLDFWRRYVEQSEVLYLDREAPIEDGLWGREPPLRLREGCVFVHGGDSFDKGPGDVVVASELVKLKRRYPDRVFLILGNRDLNKLRMSSELAPSLVNARPLRQVPGPYWVPEQRRGNIYDWIKTRFLPPEALPADLDEYLEQFNTPMNHLKFMLEQTMGAPHSFEFRRRYLQACHLVDLVRELPAERLPSDFSVQRVLVDPEHATDLFKLVGGSRLTKLEDIEVPDAQVYQSFMSALTADPDRVSWPTWLQQTHPGTSADPRSAAVFCDYLKSAQLALVLGDTLFVHGGLRSKVLGSLPKSALDLKQTPDRAHSHWRPFIEGHLGYVSLAEYTGRSNAVLRDWTDIINRWARAMVLEWLESPECNPDLSFRGGEDLMRYCTRHGSGGRGFVYESHMTDGHPDPAPLDVTDFLNRSGVRRMIVGHQPQGDAPTVVKTARMELVMADTAFSDTTAPDNRGVALSEVVLHFKPKSEIGAVPEEWGVPVALEPEAPDSLFSQSRMRIHGVLKDGMPSSVSLSPYPQNWPRFPEIYHAHQVVPEARLAPYRLYLSLLQDGHSLPRPQLAQLMEQLELAGDPFVGRQTFDGWFVKSRVLVSMEEAGEGDEPADLLRPPLIAYNLSRGKGFQVDYRPIVLPELWCMPFINELHTSASVAANTVITVANADAR